MSGNQRTFWVAVLVAALVASASGGSALAADATTRSTASADTFATCQSNGYEVTFTNVEIGTWRLIDVTVEDTVARHVEVRNLRTENGTAHNVTLENVSLNRLRVEDGNLTDVTAERLVVRNRTILDVPGAGLVGEISNRSIDRHVLKEVTVTGFVVDSIAVENMTIENRTLRNRSADGPPETVDPKSADIEMTEASVGAANIGNVTAVDWEVESNTVENESISDGANGNRLGGPCA